MKCFFTREQLIRARINHYHSLKESAEHLKEKYAKGMWLQDEGLYEEFRNAEMRYHRAILRCYNLLYRK